MTSDESKAESFGCTLVLLAFGTAIVCAPWWLPIVKDMVAPKPIIVMECPR